MGTTFHGKTPGGADATFKWLLHTGHPTLSSPRRISTGDGLDTGLVIGAASIGVANAAGHVLTFDGSALTEPRTATWRDLGGTVAFLDDIPDLTQDAMEEAITDPAAFRAVLGAVAPEDPDDSIFFDDFGRADTGDNAIGPASSGQAWTITGSGAANVRLAGGALVQVSPFATYYAWPQLGFAPTRIGCLFRYRAGGGATSYVSAMCMAKTRSLMGPMIHFTWNANNLSIEVWDGGAGNGNIQSILFSQPLEDGRLYRLELEIDAANDRVTVYGPGGETLVYTDPLVSDAASQHIFYEVSSTSTSLKYVDFVSVWATGGGSQRTHYEGRIAAEMARAADSPRITALPNLTGNVTSTAGTLSMANDIDTSHFLGRARIGSPISDYAQFTHRDWTTFGSGGITIGPSGNTSVSAPTGQGVSLGVANASKLYALANRVELGAGVDLRFEGSTADANKTILTVEDPTANRTYRFANAPTTDVLTVAAVLTKTTTGDPASGYEGQIAINTFDNTAKIYADGGWRVLASGW